MARKPKYRPDYHPAEARRLAEDMYIDVEIAAAIGIGETQFYEWKKRYPKFARAVDEGKQKVNKMIEGAYKNLALPHKLKTVIAEPDPKDKSKVKVVRVEEREVDPNERAGRMLLYNRLPHKYRERIQVDIPDDQEPGAVDAEAEAEIMDWIRGGAVKKETEK